MKLIIDIPDDAYSMITNTVFTENVEVMFKQSAEDRQKTLQLFATLDAIKDGKPYEERPQGAAISREALKEAVEKLELSLTNKKTIQIIIDNAPAVEALITNEEVRDFAKENFDLGYDMAKAKFSPKQGEWKVYGKQGGIPITDYCSNCKYEMMWYKNKYNFCPNCGADMRGTEGDK